MSDYTFDYNKLKVVNIPVRCKFSKTFSKNEFKP